MKLVPILFLALFSGNVYAQICGFEQVENEILTNPEMKRLRDSVNVDLYNWLKNDTRSRLFNQRIENPYGYSSRPKNGGNRSLCGYNNDYQGWGDAPTVVGNTLTAQDLEGGDYFTVYNMQANRTYRISTCGQNDFDTQITIYPEGGGSAVAHNDDACANNQSEILFSPLVSGNYDILIDEWDCDWTVLVDTDIDVELIYENRPVYTVPVVFHVVYNNADENVSDAEVFSQLDILNEHFRRQHSGLSNVPAAFRGQSSDPLIQFCIAQQDQNGNSTTGIIRYSTSVQEFDPCNSVECLFDANMGGATEWDRNEYVNIWVADMTGQQCGLGFSKHPFLPAIYSGLGVVVDYQCFSDLSNNLISDRQYGHTLVHEMGHYFGLWHMWGIDENTLCDTDSVSDTPYQEEKTFGIPGFPFTDDCSPNYPGKMFHNYMDYSDDFVTNMFTYLQTAVFDYTLFNWYQSLINSDGCEPALTTGIHSDQPVNNEGILTNGLIQQSTQVDRVRVYDISGKLVLEKRTTGSLSFEHLEKGFYIVHGLSKNRVVSVRRVVVQ